MNIEILSRSKYKTGAGHGDDIVLCLPGRVYGVFDGATDALGTRVNGESVGRIAARTVADLVGRTAMEAAGADLSGEQLVRAAADDLGRVNAALKLPIPASTTLAVVFEVAAGFRIVTFGDSAVRVNGAATYTHHKLIDEVSTAARVAAFRLLRRRGLEGDALEKAARSTVLLGFDQAVTQGTLGLKDCRRIVDSICAQPRFAALADAARGFINGGIRTQFTHANNRQSPLCYGSLNGTEPDLRTLKEVFVPREGLVSLEIYSDGYLSPPGGVRIADWEREFARIERTDFHKVSRHRCVKGSTSTEFSDDRSVISLTFPVPA